MFFGSVGIGSSWPAPLPVLPGGPALTPLPAPAGWAAAGSAMPISVANVAIRIVIQVNRRRLSALISVPPGHLRPKENLFFNIDTGHGASTPHGEIPRHPRCQGPFGTASYL